MLETLMKKSTDYLIRHHVIAEDDRDIYEYGFHSLYNNIINLTFVAIVSILLRQVPQTILYHLAFIVLRNTAGGFHAKTHFRCFVMSASIWLLSLWTIEHTATPMVCITIAVFSVLLIWGKAPIEHENSPLSKAKYSRMKNLSRTISIALAVIVLLTSILLVNKFIWIAASLAYGMASHSLLFLVALFEKRISKTK